MLDALAVDAVSLVLWVAESLSFEHMSKVPPTVGACDLDTLHAIGIVFVSVDGSRFVVVECRPESKRVKKYMSEAVQFTCHPSAE